MEMFCFFQKLWWLVYFEICVRIVDKWYLFYLLYCIMNCVYFLSEWLLDMNMNECYHIPKLNSEIFGKWTIRIRNSSFMFCFTELFMVEKENGNEIPWWKIAFDRLPNLVLAEAFQFILIDFLCWLALPSRCSQMTFFTFFPLCEWHSLF